MANLAEKLERETGLATSIKNSPIENFTVIIYIMNAYLSGTPLQFSHRAEDSWENVLDLPTNFENFCYRTRR